MGTRLENIQRLTEEGVNAIFNKVAKMPSRKYYEPLVNTKMLEKKIGIYDTMGNIGPAAVKDEEDAIFFDSISQNYRTTIESVTIAKGVQASLEALEYDLYSVINATFGTPLMRVMQTFKEKNVASRYNDAFTDTGADGVAILSATHPLQRSAKVNDNLATGALTPTNFIAAKNKFNFIYDQAGDFEQSEPTHLAIHPNKLYTALEILQSQLIAHELSNTKNVTNDVMPVKVVTNIYFDYASDGTSPWFLLDKTMTDAGCVLQVKRGMKLKTWWVNENEIYRGSVTEMYQSGFVSPGYGIVGSAG